MRHHALNFQETWQNSSRKNPSRSPGYPGLLDTLYKPFADAFFGSLNDSIFTRLVTANVEKIHQACMCPFPTVVNKRLASSVHWMILLEGIPINMNIIISQFYLEFRCMSIFYWASVTRENDIKKTYAKTEVGSCTTHLTMEWSKNYWQKPSTGCSSIPMRLSTVSTIGMSPPYSGDIIVERSTSENQRSAGKTWK